jgi:hypothetical protein
MSHFLSIPADAQVVEARELLRWCAEGSAAGTAACTAYIMGISDAEAAPGAMSCPKSATRAQIRKAVVSHMMTAQPKVILDLPAMGPVMLALQDAFPCRKGN